MTIHLKAGEKLMMATWKGEDLFYLTEPMEEGYVPKVKFFYTKILLMVFLKQQLSLLKVDKD